MSRSYKLPIFKNGTCTRNRKRSSIYWRTVRRVMKQAVRKLNGKNTDDVVIPQPRQIIDDIFYYDGVMDYRDNWAGKEITKKMSRK